MNSLHLAFLLAILLSSLLLQVPAAAAVEPNVNLGYARYQGAVDIATNTTSFLGIRYAAPPVGNLRWAAPQPPQMSSEIQHATTRPNACYSADMGNSPTNPMSTISKRAVSASEDCLFLSVYTPGRIVTPAKSGGLPVLVWIHGGGYITGSESPYNGADLVVKSNYSLIVVTIQYRLGVFGFLAGDVVKCGGALNAGLRGGSVLQHIIAHGGNTQPPLFRGAITSSTFLPSQYNYNDPIPELLYNEVVTGTNCTSSADTLSCLRGTDVSTLEDLNANINLDGFYGTFTFVPVVDGSFIVERPSVTLSRGTVNGDALYSVTNSHEGNYFVNQSTTLNISEYFRALFPDVEESQVAAAVPLYEGLGNNVDQANYVMGESIFVCPTYDLMEAFGSKAWKGEFAIPPGYHGQDAEYYWTTATLEFITAFSNSFLAMAISLNPSDKYDPTDITPARWDSWSGGHTEMMFNVTSSGAPNVYTYTTDSALLNRCVYWKSVAAQTAQ